MVYFADVLPVLPKFLWFVCFLSVASSFVLSVLGFLEGCYPKFAKAVVCFILPAVLTGFGASMIPSQQALSQMVVNCNK